MPGLRFARRWKLSNLPTIKLSSLTKSRLALLSNRPPTVSRSPVVYIHTSVVPVASDRSNLNTSLSSAGSMRPSIEDPRCRSDAVLMLSPWSSDACPPTPPMLSIKQKTTQTAKMHVLNDHANEEGCCTVATLMAILRGYESSQPDAFAVAMRPLFCSSEAGGKGGRGSPQSTPKRAPARALKPAGNGMERLRDTNSVARL